MNHVSMLPPTEKVPRCPCCSSEGRVKLFTSQDRTHGVLGTFQLLRCERCSCTYPDPRPTREGLASYYPSDYYAYRPPVRHRLFGRTDPAARAWYAFRRGVLHEHYGYVHLGGSRLLANTAGLLPPLATAATFGLDEVLIHPFVRGGALLDIGCGSGMYLDLMRALGWVRVVGVDTDDTAVRQVQEILGIEAHRGDLREVGLPDATFDAVSMSHALEHVEDPVAVLTEVRRVTKPGGRIAIVVPNARGLGARLLRSHWVGWETPRHLVNFSPEGLRLVMVRAGLSVTNLTTSARPAHHFTRVSMSRRRSAAASRRCASLGDAAVASAVSAAEHAACALGVRAGELIWAVGRT